LDFEVLLAISDYRLTAVVQMPIKAKSSLPARLPQADRLGIAHNTEEKYFQFSDHEILRISYPYFSPFRERVTIKCVYFRGLNIAYLADS